MHRVIVMHAGKDFARQIANVVFIPLGILLCTPSDGGVVPLARDRLPAFAYAVCDVLFVAQLAYAAWQCLPAQRADPALRRVGWLTALFGLLQGLWMVAFDEEAITLSWVMMLTMLVVLILVERRLRGGGLWPVRVTYALALGWISVATIFDTSLFLRDVVGWSGAPLPALLVVLAVVEGLGLRGDRRPMRRAILAT